MEFKEQVKHLLDAFLETREDLFLIELKISAAYDITVILDGDFGVTVQDCLDASRAIENNLDREVQDFGLQVMSYGISEPILLPRQYKKNSGRKLEVFLLDDSKIEGELVSVKEEEITLFLKYRKPKEIGKGKMDVEEERVIPLAQIKKAMVVIKF